MTEETKPNPMDEEVEKWYYDLGEMAKRIDKSIARNHRANVRVVVLSLFVLFAFLVLSWRYEQNANRIDRNSTRIVDVQNRSCLRSIEIVERFNEVQEGFIQLDKQNPTPGDEKLQARRIELLEQSKIPLPHCPP